MNLVDTSGWLEYFFDGPNAVFFSKSIENIEKLVVPTICLYEVFKKVNLVADEAGALRAVAQMKQGRIVPLGEDIALKAGIISLRFKLPMADSIIYATAQMEKAVLWTQDEHFKNLPQIKFKGKH
jgi:predicted nucleic acid-binding protein